MPHIEHLSIRGFKSIRKLANFELKSLNVLIGANGAGKSNLLSLFEMVSAISQKSLQLFVMNEGRPDILLFGGRKLTSSIEVALSFENNRYGYEFSLKPKSTSIGFGGEKLSTVFGSAMWPGGGGESRMFDSFDHMSEAHCEEFAAYVFPDIQCWRVFHFQDMSNSSRVRNQSEVRDNLRLRSDAGNLAPFLRYLHEHHPDHYRRIRNIVRMAHPFIKDFVYRKALSPDDNIGLEWYGKLIGSDTDTVLGPRQLSDGTLRFICLATLLNQPEYLQPDIILIDEPELGLHSFALTIVAEMIKQVADLKQIIISTQSAELVSHFEPEEIVVVDRKEEESVLKRLDPAPLTHWLEDYSLGDLWKMNVLGGRS
ncbi:MAG: AAA family ATPase [Bacteroidetes bacterium]|nr:AAA family ATPase [Bacteroidota bacterium]